MNSATSAMMLLFGTSLVILFLDAASLDTPQTLDSFSLRMYKQLSRETTNGNIFYSPLSVAIGLGMVLEGAHGTTAKELLGALTFNGKLDSREAASTAFRDLFRNLARGNCGETIKLASRALIASDIFKSVRPAYKNLLKRNFESELVETVFRNGQKVQDDINKWVDRATNGTIRELLSEPLPSATKLYLLNAIYFRGVWATSFNERDTRSGVFTNLNGQQRRNVKFMETRGQFRIYDEEDEDYKLLEIPYEGDTSMVIILPREGKTIKAVTDRLTTDALDVATQNLRQTDVHIKLPKFNLELKYELAKTLTAIGLGEMFSNDADLSGISRSKLKVDQVVHKAVIEVNEEGTVAAAVTGIGVVRTSMPQFEQFYCNKPFVFYIREEKLSTVLFVGRVSQL